MSSFFPSACRLWTLCSSAVTCCWQWRVWPSLWRSSCFFHFICWSQSMPRPYEHTRAAPVKAGDSNSLLLDTTLHKQNWEVARHPHPVRIGLWKTIETTKSAREFSFRTLCLLGNCFKSQQTLDTRSAFVQCVHLSMWMHTGYERLPRCVKQQWLVQHSIWMIELFKKNDNNNNNGLALTHQLVMTWFETCYCPHSMTEETI